ncbi:MAG: DUF721 domain-containing protein [Fibromonadaceae bacterium]|jgi:hypothetical protein|nr:DUF721 domain-containing protein [Fibromonadaceae bacterium]
MIKTKRKQSEPLKASVLAMNLLDSLLSQEQKDIIILETNRNQILPKKLQTKVKITALSKGTLLLKVDSSVWRAETVAIKTSIITTCNHILGKIAVKTVKIS